MSSRVPIFRQFPREGIPPHYGTWEIFSHRVELMMRAGAIPDYTFLWWDVRPHPQLGTVETRIFDQQTRVEHTVALAALTVCLAHRLCALYDADEPLVEYPTELIDDNKIRAARHGTDGKLVDFRAGEQVQATRDGARAGRAAGRERRRARLPRRSSIGRGPARQRHRSAPPARALRRRPDDLRGAGRRDRRAHPPLSSPAGELSSLR